MSELVLLTVDHSDDRTLAEAASLISEPETVGLLYSGTNVRFVVFRDGRWQSSSGTDDLFGAFEAIFFNDARQVRWVFRGDDRGDTAVLSDSVAERTEPSQAYLLDETPRSLLLWGQIARVPKPGWVTCQDARTAAIDVPVREDAVIGGRVTLAQRDYFCQDDHGNVSVADSRYLRLSIEKG